METKQQGKASANKGRWKARYLIAGYRLAIILAGLVCLWLLPKEGRELDTQRILEEVADIMPGVVSVGQERDGFHALFDKDGGEVGWAVSTFPQADKVYGYSGASELLVIFDQERQVRGVKLLGSGDTEGHVEKVLKDQGFWAQWNGRQESSLGEARGQMIVSGATLTSEAMVRGVAARFGAKGMDEWFPRELIVDDVAKWFPKADRLARERATYHVYEGEKKAGVVLRSTRMGVSARGYNGISDVIVAIDGDGEKILGVGLLGSRDNEPYVGDVKEELKYADGFKGKTVDEILAEDGMSLLFTSGASRTTRAVVESVKEMLRRHVAENEGSGFPWKSALSIAWIGMGFFMGFHRWGKGKKARMGFAVISIVAGVTLGWMVSQDQLAGWGRNGLDVMKAMPLLILTACALVVPALTGKNVYCSRICPHGAAQTLAGSLVKKRFALPPKLHRVLVGLPWLSLVVIWVLAFVASGFPLGYFEPFESWSSGFVAFVPAAIFTIGLGAAFFFPQGYCHYGCPTGALFKFLAHAPGRWTRKDAIAGVLLVSAIGYVIWMR